AAPPPAFDRDYIDQQIRAHRQAIALFTAEAQGGQNPVLRRLAQQALPILRSHLREAEAIAGGIA
ncbi:MAG TPA: DUF4142 domain-containing protein, partial [Stellaceae bacterium]|nr:DUF4142 domain-containing protein [Stellaceae bacterium]